MGNPYDLLVLQDAHLAEWSDLSTHPDIANLSGAIDAKNTVTVNASGAVSAGQIVAMNADGTVSAVYKDADTATEPVTASDDTIIDFAPLSIYDPVSGKTAAFWTRNSKQWGGIAELSGSVVQWDDIHEINSTDFVHGQALTYHEREQMILQLGMLSAPHNLYALTISAGSSADVFVEEAKQALPAYPAILPISPGDSISMTYDSVNEKGIIFYGDYITDWGAMTIELSGGTITFGDTTVAPSTREINYTRPSTFDTTAGMFITSMTYNTFDTGHLSGDGVVVFDETVVYETTGTLSVMYDIIYISDWDRFVFTYHDATEGFTKICVGKIVDSIVEIGTPVAFPTEYSLSVHDHLAYDPVQKRLWFSYQYTSSQYVREIFVDDVTVSYDDEMVISSADTKSSFSLVYQPTTENFMGIMHRGASTHHLYGNIFSPGASNLLQDNYLGIAQETVTHGNPVLVYTLGNIDRNQTGLTVPSKYYSDMEGNLVTTRGVEVGKALNSTDLLITR